MKILIRLGAFTRLKGFKADLIRVTPQPNGSFSDKLIASANPGKKHLLFEASRDQIFGDSKKATLLLTITDTNEELGNMRHKKQKNQWTFADGSETFELDIKLKGKKSKKIKQVLRPNSLALVDDLSENNDLQKPTPTPTAEPTSLPFRDDWTTRARPTIEAALVVEQAQNEGPRKRYGDARFKQSLDMDVSQWNIPKENPSNNIYVIADNIDTSTSDLFFEWEEIVRTTFGGYDNLFWIYYDSMNEQYNNKIIQSLDEYGYFDSFGIKPSMDSVDETKGCLAGFVSDNERLGPKPMNTFSFCSDTGRYKYHTHDDPHKLQGDVYPETKVMGLNGFAHEYFHHVQRAHDLAAGNIYGNGQDLVKAPAWFLEGIAQITPMWILRDNFDNLSLSKEYGLSYDDIVSDTTGDNDKGLNLYNLKDYLGGGAGWPERGYEFWVSRFNSNDSDPCSGGADSSEENYETAKGCDWHWMAAFLMHITSPQVAIADILSDQWEYGFEGAFAKNVGLTLDQFYEEFNSFVRSGKPEQEQLPKEFWIGDKPISEEVDFWGIDSGPKKSSSTASFRFLLDGHQDIVTGDVISKNTSTAEMDFLRAQKNAETRTVVKGSERVDIVDIEPGYGYKVIKKFDTFQDQISFCGCPATKLDSYNGNAYISKGGDLEAIVKGVQADELMIIGNKIIGA